MSDRCQLQLSIVYTEVVMERASDCLEWHHLCHVTSTNPPLTGVLRGAEGPAPADVLTSQRGSDPITHLLAPCFAHSYNGNLRTLLLAVRHPLFHSKLEAGGWRLSCGG
jgi:hypothetical protein